MEMEATSAAAPGSREFYPHLRDDEWEAFRRMGQVYGDAVVIAMLGNLSEDAQRAAARSFMLEEERALHREALATALARPTAAPAAPRVETLKLAVSPFKGEGEPLLRWLTELDIAIQARNIMDVHLQVSFAMSVLGGRARTWAYGRKMADANCFASYEDFKRELREAFEPPKSQFRARAEFLALRQGKSDVHAYAQRARYLVSSIVTEPLAHETQVVTFMMGLNDGPVKTYLFREYPTTLENAIALAVQEDFSLKQARMHSHASSQRVDRPYRRERSGSEPMDLSYAQSSTPRGRPRECHRCRQEGHFAYECTAPKPSPRENSPRPGRSVRGYGRGPKNGGHQ
jgi:hypothetical protein